MRRTTIAAVATLAALTLAGCGSSDTSSSSPSTTSTEADPLGPGAPAPAGWSCEQIGGRFEAHGTDGRGSCVPTDPRPECHVPPGQQDGNYVSDFEMTPPFPGGTVAPAQVRAMLDGASDANCWKIPAQ
ncbi:hypothetical protein [Nocardia nova]